MNTVRYAINELPPLTKKQQENLKHLATLSDDDIDLSDIPEVTDWSDAVRGNIKTQNFVADECLVRPSIVAKFKDKAKQNGSNYQDLINDALEEYLLDH